MLPIKRFFLLFATAQLCLLGCGSESPDSEPGNRGAEQAPNLLLVVVDTLRKDHLGFYGYTEHPTSPTLDQWAREGVVIDGLTGVTSWTMPSMATLYTGRTPAEHRVMRMTGNGPGTRLNDSQTLASLLRGNGYATGCIMTNFLLLGRRGFNQGFDRYNDSLIDPEHPHHGSTASQVADLGIEWLQKSHARQPGKPWMLNLHFFDPHTSYEDQPDFDFTDPQYTGWVQSGLENSVYKAHQSSTTEDDRAQLRALYDEEIRAVDQALAQVQSYLLETDQWRNTLVVVTSDHGEELAERGYIGHTRTLHFEQIDLPLLLKFPGQAHSGEKRVGIMSQVDLYATLLDLCQVQPPPDRGSSRAAWVQGQAEIPNQEMAFFEVDFVPYLNDPDRFIQKRGVKSGHLGKFVVNLKTQTEYFFSPADPLELQNLISDPASQSAIQSLRRAYDAHTWYQASNP
jgi:arylsulfatase A-like enzyme